MGHSPSSDLLSGEAIERVLASIDIPPCPAIVVQVMDETQRDDPDINRLARIIANDVGMAASAIKLANSPLFSRGAPVGGVPQAVARLGLTNIGSIVVTAALRDSLKGLPEDVLERFWQRASTVALAAGMIARRLYGIAADQAHAYALFHDAAIPVLMRRFPGYVDVLAQAQAEGSMLCALEERHFGCSHDIVGALLARNWGLSPRIAQAIRFHHDAGAYELPEKVLAREALSLIAVTQVAEYLGAEILGEPDFEVGETLYARAVAHLGLSPAELSDLHEDLAQRLHQSGQ